MHGAVSRYVIVIPDRCETPRPVTGDDGFQRKAPVAARCAAMNYDQVYPTVILVLTAV